MPSMTAMYLLGGLLAAFTAPAVLAQDWVTVFRDGFDEAASGDQASEGGLDLRLWTFDIGTRDMSNPDSPGPPRWGNNEPQHYTDRCAPAKLQALFQHSN